MIGKKGIKKNFGYLSNNRYRWKGEKETLIRDWDWFFHCKVGNEEEEEQDLFLIEKKGKKSKMKNKKGNWEL